MTEPVFRGVGVALLTFFDDDGRLDATGTAAFADRLVERGIEAIVVAGTTGEASKLERSERTDLLDAVVDTVRGRVPVVAGTGAATADVAETLTTDAVAHGADAVLVLSPPDGVDLNAYYSRVARAAGDTPVLAYHYPAVSPPGIPVALLPDLPVVGLKDSSGDPERLLRELDALDDRALYTGSSALLSFAGPLGCAGAILGLANLEPELCIKAYGGDADAQRALLPSHLAAKTEFPRGLKQAVAEVEGLTAVCR